MAERFVRISGWGKYLPERVMPDAELAELVDTSDEWIRARTGIGERRIAAPDETTCTLAVHAARQALEQARLAPGSQFIVSGAYRSVLVIGAEVFTRILDWQDRSTCVLFGDGAGAVVLQPTSDPGGPLAFSLGSDGSGACSLYVPAGGSRRPAARETVDNREHYVKMMGREVFRFATRVVPESVLQALEAASLTTDDIDVFIPHQANVRIIDSAARRLRLENRAVFS